MSKIIFWYESQLLQINLLIAVCTCSRYCAVHTIAAKLILNTSDDKLKVIGMQMHIQARIFRIFWENNKSRNLQNKQIFHKYWINK